MNAIPSSSENTKFNLATWQPIKIGPTWTQDKHGDFILPEYSLGWEVAAWIATWLIDDDGKPFVLTNEQFRFLLWFYAIDEQGRFIYQDATLQRMKG